MENHFYTRNAALLDDPAINILFEESMSMSDDEFSDWTRQLRKVIAKTWDEGIPPRNGLDEQGIIRQLDRMSTYPVHEFLTEDILTGDKNVIRNETNIGNVANQWYPGMLQTRIAYSKDLSKAKSVYDWVIDDSLHERFLKYVRRHYQRDGFYHYSLPVRRNNEKDFLFHTESGEEWVKWFEDNKRHYLEDDYWLAPKRLDMGYTGAAEDSEIEHELFIPKERISDLPIPESSKCNMGNPDDCDGYQIRYYKLGQRIFPLGLKTFRVSFCQYAVNFPPLTARYLYERYTEHIKDQDEINIYDPSMALIRQLCTEYIIFPLGSEIVRNRLPEHVRSFLFYGPTGSGKTLMVRACITETNSTLFDLSHYSIEGKYTAKKEEEKLVALIMVTAKHF